MREKIEPIEGTNLGIRVRRVVSKAKAGDPEAQLILGQLYLQGRGVRRNVRAGVKYLTSSAEQGNTLAQVVLSGYYRGAGKDPAKAHSYTEQAAAAGNADAQMQLGFDYHNGYAVERDDREAEAWLKKASDQGNYEAMAYLGNLHLTSPDPQVSDPDRGMSELSSASERGNGRASFFLGMMYGGYGHVPENRFMAYRMISRSADQGDPDGLLYYGMMCMEGTPYVEQDRARAFEYYQRAADAGCRDACTYIGTSYLFGLGVDTDNDKALTNLKKGVQNGSPVAMINLAVMYANGIGVRRDDSEAASLYRRAADMGSPKAMSNLGVMYATGRGVPKDEDRARELLTRAAELGDENAAHNLLAMESGATDIRNAVTDGNGQRELVVEDGKGGDAQ